MYAFLLYGTLMGEEDEDRWLFWFFPSMWLWKRFFR
jgi:hypothetical protein